MVPPIQDAPYASREAQALPDALPALRPLPIVTIAIVWTLWGIWSAQQSELLAKLSGQPPAATNPLSLALVTAWWWTLLTPLIMTVARRIRDRVASPTSRVAAHLATFAIVHLLDATVYSLATRALAASPRAIVPLLFSLLTFNALAYAAAVAIVYALDAETALRARLVRQSQLETQLALAQFHALRAQLHPHFLFNALNAVSSLIHTDPARADRMLARVSELLRMAIDTAVDPEVRLVDEMEFTRRYLDIERMRYGDRLDVRINVPGETFDALVPNMLLQPLVENAVRHGVAPYARAGRIEVNASRSGDQLSIVVRDSGAGYDGDAEDATGVGLRTTRARLEKLYGARQRLTTTHVPDGFETRVLVPFRWREPVS